MAATNRLGTIALTAGALALAGLMAYTLVGVDPDWTSPSWTAPSAAQVAVLFPDRADWLDFRHGIAACERKGVVRAVSEEGDAVRVATPRLGRSILFRYHPARGVVETRGEVRRLAGSALPPVAYVGSSNTELTFALVDELRAIGTEGGPSAVVLVPWATAVSASADRPPLLATYPGHVFRVCPNNRSEAELVVARVASRGSEARPGRVILVTDPADPYSTDLAASFRAAVATAMPRAEVVELAASARGVGPDDEPTGQELAWADRIAELRASAPGSGPTWLVLPLQEHPTRRLLHALVASRRATEPRALEILCGDGVGLETLGLFTGSGLSIWCVSAASEAGASPDGPQDLQVSAEVVAALAWVIDRGAATAPALREGLAKLDLAAKDPGAMGRSLGFTPEGERSGADLGRVFHLASGGREALAHSRGPEGAWAEPSAIPLPPPTEARR